MRGDSTIRVRVLCGAIVLGTLLGGCASGGRSAGVARPASAEARAALLDQVKGLKGEWEMLDEQGKPAGAIRFELTSAGNVVREVMFPGSEHEMTNMYHMDGDALVMTHYCAVGNQPQMRARSGTLPSNGRPGEIAMRFDRVTNKSSADQAVMGNMTLVFVSADSVREEWTQVDPTKEHGRVVMNLRRKKS